MEKIPKSKKEKLSEGSGFHLPGRESLPAPEGKRISPGNFSVSRRLVKQQREMGREIVVVMGVGFVGAVMAGVVADTVDPKTGEPTKFVIGMQRPSPQVLLENRLSQ